MAINPKLLRSYGIYRVVYYTPKTNFRPLVFVLYAGPMKVHALSINAPTMTSTDTMQFISFIRKMRNIKGVEKYSPRVMYRILRTYYPGIVRKTYRTYITQNIGSFSLISIGLVPSADNFTDLERSAFSSALKREASNFQAARMINIATKTEYIPPTKPPVFVAPKTMKQQEPENIKKTDIINNKKPSPMKATIKRKPNIPKDAEDELGELYGEQ